MAKADELQPRASYPWKDWLDGREHEAFRGADFSIALKAFRNNLYTKACLLKKNVATKIKPGTSSLPFQSGSVVFRFYSKDENGRPVISSEPTSTKGNKRAVQKSKAKATNKTRKRPSKSTAAS